MNELKHYGVLGMRWGRRKGASSTTPTTPRNPSKDHVRKSQLKKKKISEMTNDELKEITSRLQLEKQYKDLTRTDVTPGKKFVMDVLATTAKTTATAYATKYAAKGAERLIKKSAKS